jgi:hypothetical protein
MPAQLGHVALGRAEQRRAVVSSVCVPRGARKWRLSSASSWP